LRDQVARDRHEPQDRVEAQPDAGAGDDEQGVHRAGDGVTRAIAASIASRSRRSMPGRVPAAA
jgi:hypothetical protein